MLPLLPLFSGNVTLFLLFLFAFIFSNHTVAATIDYSEVELYAGDVDGDGSMDIYFHTQDDFILLHGKVTVPLNLNANSFIKKPSSWYYVEEETYDDDGSTYVEDCQLTIAFENPAVNTKTLSVKEIELLGLNKLEIGADYQLLDIDGDDDKDLYLKIADFLDDFANSVGIEDRLSSCSGFDNDGPNALVIENADTFEESTTWVVENQTLVDFYVDDINGDGIEELVTNDIVGGAYYYVNYVPDVGWQESYYGLTSVIQEPTLHGASTGSFRVNESGAATYMIPIASPAGTAGVAPSFSLNYSSQS